MTRAPLIFGSVCSGIEAASVAWEPLGWTPSFFAEIDPTPSKVLAHRHPHVPNLGDFTRPVHRDLHLPPINVLVGGTPCQAFSVAGLRRGFADARGNLTLEFLRLAGRLHPRWILWENVPGVLSVDGGRAFGAFLGGLAELGYGFAYRVLDAQFFGVPQRRRRVFVVGCAGGAWDRAAAVLFEPEGLRGDPGARRAPGADHPGAPGDGAAGGGERIAKTPTAHNGRMDASVDNYVVTPIAFDTTQITHPENRSRPQPGSPCHPLAASAHPPAIAFHPQQDPISGPALSVGTTKMGVLSAGTVRRLTPRECERLQGFPDDYTLVPGISDAGRYRTLGNSMAVPVMRWLGERIDKIDRQYL